MTEALDGLWAIASSQDGLRAWVEAQGPLAPLAFFLVEVAQVIVSPLPGGLLPAWALPVVASGAVLAAGLANRARIEGWLLGFASDGVGLGVGKRWT